MKECMDQSGEIKTQLQGVYVLALKMRLVPEDLRKNAVKKLKK